MGVPCSTPATADVKPMVECVFDKTTGTAQYVVWCPETKKAVIIDGVWDFQMSAGRFTEKNINLLCEVVAKHGLEVSCLLDTHVHADHVTALQQLKQKFPTANTVIGANVVKVQQTFKELFNVTDLQADGSSWDLLVADGECRMLGNVRCQVFHTPGHTPACSTYLIGDAAFVGDTIFMPDSGTARCDFPNGSADLLAKSIREKIYTLPDSTRVFVGHDYGSGGKRDVAWETTVGELKTKNTQFNMDTKLEDFAAWRKQRDASLDVPNLILPSLQINLRGGRLPPPDTNGRVYLKLPIGLF